MWCFIHCIQSITNTGFALIIGMMKNFQIHGLDKQALHSVFVCTLQLMYEELKHFNRSDKTWKDKQSSKLWTLLFAENT